MIGDFRIFPNGGESKQEDEDAIETARQKEKLEQTRRREEVLRERAIPVDPSPGFPPFLKW